MVLVKPCALSLFPLSWIGSHFSPLFSPTKMCITSTTHIYSRLFPTDRQLRSPGPPFSRSLTPIPSSISLSMWILEYPMTERGPPTYLRSTTPPPPPLLSLKLFSNPIFSPLMSFDDLTLRRMDDI
jgi:hypothetical protein